MAPSEITIANALRGAVEEVFNSAERENLTVRLIRDKVEADLELEKGLLVGDQWKEKTKRIIKDYAVSIVCPTESTFANTLSTIGGIDSIRRSKDFNRSQARTRPEIQTGFQEGQPAGQERNKALFPRREVPTQEAPEEGRNPVGDFRALRCAQRIVTRGKF